MNQPLHLDIVTNLVTSSPHPKRLHIRTPTCSCWLKTKGPARFLFCLYVGLIYSFPGVSEFFSLHKNYAPKKEKKN